MKCVTRCFACLLACRPQPRRPPWINEFVLDVTPFSGGSIDCRLTDVNWR